MPNYLTSRTLARIPTIAKITHYLSLERSSHTEYKMQHSPFIVHVLFMQYVGRTNKAKDNFIYLFVLTFSRKSAYNKYNYIVAYKCWKVLRFSPFFWWINAFLTFTLSLFLLLLTEYVLVSLYVIFYTFIKLLLIRV